MYSEMKKLVVLMLTPDHSNYIYYPAEVIVNNALTLRQTLIDNLNDQTLSNNLNTFFSQISTTYSDSSPNYPLSNITTLMTFITSLFSQNLENINYDDLTQQVSNFQKFISSQECPTIPDPKDNNLTLSLYDHLLVILSEYFTQLGLQNLITPQQLSDVFIQGVPTNDTNPDEEDLGTNNPCTIVVKGKIRVTKNCSDTSQKLAELKFKITLNQ